MTVKWLDGAAGRALGRAAAESPLRGNTAIVTGAYDGMSAVLARDARVSDALSVGRRLVGLHGVARPWPPHPGGRLEAGAGNRRASHLPVILDCDTGFGEALNVMRVVREMEEIGVACIQIEDQH